MDKARTKSGNLTNVVAYALIGCIAFVVMKCRFHCHFISLVGK